MIPISDAGRQRLENYRGDWLITMTFTLLGGGDDLVINRDRVWGGSLVLEDAVSNSGQFEIGSTHINQMTVTLLNTDGTYDAVNFLDAKVKVEIGWHSGSLLTKGYYTIVDAQVSNGMIALKGYDYMDRFSRSYKLSTRTYPCTLKQIVAEACTFCNVTDGTGNFDHYSQRIAKKPEDDTLTFREVIGYVAQICGYNARVARNGRLQFVRYNLSGFNGEDTYNTITDVYSDRIDQDQIVITGIHVDEENTVVTTDSDGIKTTSLVTTGYDAGTDGYVISIAGNPLIKDGLGQNVASWLYTAFGGVPFRIGSVTHASDPCIEASDIMKVTDKYGTYNMLVSETRFCTGSAQTTSSNAVSPRSNEAVQYTDIDKIKTVASEAHIVALAAQGYANDAQRAANEAQSSADSAAQAAQTAWDHADDAGEAAQTAWNRAGDALTAANNAQTSANNAATAASNAQTSANNAQTSANNAQTQAELATGYAGSALIQLSEVEQVADILNWIAEHGTYAKTTDTTIVQGKNYYTKSGNVYTLVTDPQQSDIGNYYELHIDEALSNYVSTHLALTNDGLYVIKDANGYRLKIDESSVQVIDGYGTTVATYGSDITYDPYREHTIGNGTNYIKFYDSDNDNVADSIAIIADSIVLGTSDLGDTISKVDNMQVGGRNLIRNTNVIDLSQTATRPNINGDNTANGCMTGANAGTLTAAEHGARHTVTDALRPGIMFGANNVNAGLHGLAAGKTYTWSFDYTVKTFSGTPPTTSNYYLRAILGYVPEGESAFNTSTYANIHQYATTDLSDRGSAISGHGEFTFELPEGATAMRFYITTNSTNTSYYASGDFVELRNIKLEEGNVPTAWTPAPEDIDAQIDNIEIGGKNLLTGTNTTTELTETGYWVDHTWRSAGSGTGTITAIMITDCPDKSITRGWQFDVTSVSSDAYSASRSIGQNRIPIIAGQEYTLSCYAKGTGKLYMFYGISSFAPVDLSGKTDLTSEWKRYSVTFTAESGTAYVNANGSNVFFGIWGTNVTGYICGMKLETGNKFTDWTPAPEDFDTVINGKVTTFYQASQPTATATGDLWIDTDDNNKMYRWNGTQWADIQDGGIANAQSTAENALAQGLVLRVNSSTFTNTNNGECYYHGYNRWNVAADVDGWVMWNGAKVTIPKGCSINPNSTMPFDKTIYSVYRTSDTAFHDVCLIGDTWYGTKYTGTSPSARSAWTWDVATDIVLASYRIPAAEGAIYGARLFSPPKTYNDIVDVALKEAEDAKKVAINYMSQDSTGVMVADLTDGVQTPSTATGRNVLITSNDVQVRDGQDSLASFGDYTRVGKEGEAHMNIESGGIKGIDGEGKTFFDLDVSGSASTRWAYQEVNTQLTVGQSTSFTITDSAIISGTFIFVYYRFSAQGQIYSFTFDHGTASTESDAYCSCVYSANGTFTFKYNTAMSGIDAMTVLGAEYQSNAVAPSLLFGSHVGDVGNYAVGLGEGLRLDSNNMTAVGKYNAASQGVLFVVGNGRQNNDRSNAFYVDDTGHGSFGGSVNAGGDIWTTYNVDASHYVKAGQVRSYTPTWASGETGSDFYCVTSAGMCHLMYQGQSKTHAVNTLLFTLPTGCVPSAKTEAPFVKEGKAYGFVTIDTDGTVTVKAISSTTQSGRIYINCSFPVAILSTADY